MKQNYQCILLPPNKITSVFYYYETKLPISINKFCSLWIYFLFKTLKPMNKLRITKNAVYYQQTNNVTLDMAYRLTWSTICLNHNPMPLEAVYTLQSISDPMPTGA